MSLYNDLTTVLTPYATKIKKNTSDIEGLRNDVEHLDVATDTTLTQSGVPADAETVGNALNMLDYRVSALEAGGGGDVPDADTTRY